MKIKAALLLVFCGVFFTWNVLLSTQRKNLNGVLVPVRIEDVVLKVSCPGKIEPKIQDTIRSEVDGKKKEMFVRVGDEVKKGQKLMEIFDTQIRLELSQKQTAESNSKSDMLKAKKDWRLEKELFNRQAVAKRDVENAEQTYERALQAYLLSKQELALAVKKLNGTIIFSTMDGVVLKAFPDEEDYVTAGREVFKVAKMDTFMVKGKVDELDISQVQVGQDALIQCDAFAGVQIKGRVDRIGAQAAEGTFAEIEVLIDIIDASGVKLKPNLSAEASIIAGRMSKAIVVPTSAVRRDPKGTYVLVSGRGGWLRKRPVQVVKLSGGEAVISSGLDTKESVLTPKEE